jgi:DEAD/DEAH box helicase domain-containing protein
MAGFSTTLPSSGGDLLQPRHVRLDPSPPIARTSPPIADPSALIDSVVAGLSEDPRFVHRHRVLPHPGRAARLEPPTAKEIAATLPVLDLWAHQVEAIDHLRSRRNVVITTGTGSGKSLCYQVPAVEAALQGRSSILVFPTKALAHDQLTSLAKWVPPGIVVAAFDGDCSPTERRWVRSNADIVLTNPEMLHQGILANHRRWDRLLRTLHLVVVDEMHQLRGVFGSHVCHVLRRLQRLAHLYSGHDPVFAFTSATIGEPEALAEALCGSPVTSVSHDQSAAGMRNVVLWNPLVAGGADRSVRSLQEESASMAAELVGAGLRTLVFCESRRATELTAIAVREHLRRRGDVHAPSVRAYRAGYLQEERREIEAALSDGSLGCVVATTALELGIDVGCLDAVVLAGYPGTSASFNQRIGRVGRGARASLAVLVAGEDQLDQWMMHHPREVFRRPPERAVVNPSNRHVLLPQLACAADELPLRRGDEHLWPDDLDDGVRELVLTDRLRLRPGAAGTVACWSGRGAPAPTVGLRSSSRREVAVRRPDGSLVATVDACRAGDTVHTGAVYLHQGVSWLVKELDLDTLIATVEPADGSFYTQTRRRSQVRILDTHQTREVGCASVRLGTVEVMSQVTGYVRLSTKRHRVLGSEALDLPPNALETAALWWVFSPETVAAAGVSESDLPGALHAAEHAGIGILPLFAICDRRDVGGISTPHMAETSGPTVIIHDGAPGGTGTAQLAFAAAPRHLQATLEVLTDCTCSAGCPSCVQSPKCGSGNEPLNKVAAIHLLSTALTPPSRPPAPEAPSATRTHPPAVPG